MAEIFTSETDDYNEWMSGIAERQAVLSREVRVLTKHMGPEDKQWGHNPGEVVARLEDMRREIESLRSRVIELENEKDAQGQRVRWMKPDVDETKSPLIKEPYPTEPRAECYNCKKDFPRREVHAVIRAPYAPGYCDGCINSIDMKKADEDFLRKKKKSRKRN